MQQHETAFVGIDIYEVYIVGRKHVRSPKFSFCSFRFPFFFLL